MQKKKKKKFLTLELFPKKCCFVFCIVLMRKGVGLTSNSSCQAAGVDELSIFRVCLAGETLD